MPYGKKKHAALFEEKNGKFSLLRRVPSSRLLEDIESIEDAEVIARLLNYKIVKIYYLDEE
tara:strand:+ start:565 stop:747 length:183 start_codon:yes stop_codon:yes gene_type:complete